VDSNNVEIKYLLRPMT